MSAVLVDADGGEQSEEHQEAERQEPALRSRAGVDQDGDDAEDEPDESRQHVQRVAEGEGAQSDEHEAADESQCHRATHEAAVSALMRGDVQVMVDRLLRHIGNPFEAVRIQGA
jgi:hypothetical protein